MNTTTLSEFRSKIKSHLDSTVDRHEPLVVRRQQGEDVVVMSLSDYNSHTETVSLMAKPANAIKLMKSIAEYRAGNIITVNLENYSE